jgi:anti-sigma factor RsiW
MRDRVTDRRLIRYLHGELPAADVQALRAELARDPALQARLHELHRLWQGLKAAPPTPVPYGYVSKVQRVAEEQRRREASTALGWAAAPPWVRALAGAALLGGVAIGVGLGRLQAPAPVVSAPAPGVSAVPTGNAAGSVAGDAGAVVVSQRGAPVVTEGVAASGRGTAPQAGSSTATRPDPAMGSLFVDPDDDAAGEAAAPIAGGSTLAEAYWQALASDDVGGSEPLAEGSGLW